MKCKPTDPNACDRCKLYPMRLPEDVYRDLNFIPDPVKRADGTFKTFEETYGTSTNDKDRPSFSRVATISEVDRTNAKLLVSGKVRDTILCSLCRKPRCIYSAYKLTTQQILHIDRVKEENVYTCGGCLPDQAENNVVVRDSINCTSMIEITYYSSKKFDDVCIYCGDGGNLLEDDEVRRLKREVQVVRPICTECRRAGKSILTWGASNAAGRGRGRGNVPN